MAKKGKLSNFETQKSNKPTIEAVVEQLLDGDGKKDFIQFLDWLKQEKIRLQWGSTNSFNANYKSKRVARIEIGRGGKNEINHVSIIIHTAERDKFDGYLEGQTDEIVSIFMKSISKICNECGNCAPGKTFDMSGKHYERVCFDGLGSHGLRYINPDAGQVETVKKLMNARKDYIEKMLALGLNPGTAY